MKAAPVSLVVAVAGNNVIGSNGDLPWRLSSDLKRFKTMTMGKPVIMGRKCFESIGKALPGRPNIVITRNPDYRPDGVMLAGSLEDGLEIGQALASDMDAEEVCVIGGGEIYRLAMPLADLLHVTHVDAQIEGDTFFPEIDPEDWDAQDEGRQPAGEKDQYSMRFVTYRRKR